MLIGLFGYTHVKNSKGWYLCSLNILCLGERNNHKEESNWQTLSLLHNVAYTKTATTIATIMSSSSGW